MIFSLQIVLNGVVMRRGAYDLKHDIYLEARALGINLLDAGHYSTETVVCPVVAGWLEAAFPELQVTVSQRQGEVFQYF